MNKRYNFDKIINRQQHNSKKWTNWQCLGFDTTYPDVLPMWIADMDFACEPRILAELEKGIRWGVIGYDAEKASFYEAFMDWQVERNGWQLNQEWLVPTPGVVAGIANAIRALTDCQDRIVIQPPVYYPFFNSIKKNGRIISASNLVYGQHGYSIDFHDLEQKLSQAKMFILCSPHNPVGRVWTNDELERIAKLCLKYQVVIVSDEIHGDLVFRGHKHIPIASLSPEIAEQTITLTAPSKSFNVPGLNQSVAVISNQSWRQKYAEGLCASGLMHMTTFGIIGFEAAYRYGKDWLIEVIDYIEANLDYAVDYIKRNIPLIRTYKPQGTFLMWLDLREVEQDKQILDRLLVEKGKVLMDRGVRFGGESEGFYRLNVAVPRMVLKEALHRLEKVCCVEESINKS